MGNERADAGRDGLSHENKYLGTRDRGQCQADKNHARSICPVQLTTSRTVASFIHLVGPYSVISVSVTDVFKEDTHRNSPKTILPYE